MDKYRSDGEEGYTIVLCLYSSYAAGHTNMGVRRIPMAENQAIYCIWLVG